MQRVRGSASKTLFESTLELYNILFLTSMITLYGHLSEVACHMMYECLLCSGWARYGKAPSELVSLILFNSMY